MTQSPCATGWSVAFWVLAAVAPLPCRAAEGAPEVDKRWAPASVAWGVLGPANSCFYTRAGGHGQRYDGRLAAVGFAVDASRDLADSPLPEARSHGYSIRYPRLHEGDLIPLFGCLYSVGAISDEKATRRLGGVHRAAAKDVPEGLQLRADRYVFPLETTTVNALYYSGRLHDRYVYVWNIERAHDGGLRARVGVLAHPDEYPRGEEDQIEWRWIRADDILEIGGYRHRVVAIVPPRELDSAGRDGARMIGWIELDPKGEKVEPAD